MNPIKKRCLVAGKLANGRDELFLVNIQCSSDQVQNNKHHEAAAVFVSSMGIDISKVYDETDAGAQYLLNAMKWPYEHHLAMGSAA